MPYSSGVLRRRSHYFALFFLSLPVVLRCFIIGFIVFSGMIQSACAECWYEDERHDEGVQVATAEPCLNCTCSRGVLLCYLRVCPKLPNPPPPGCILLHRYRTCCPELICTDLFGNGNSLEGRSDPEIGLMELSADTMAHENGACMSNGSIYGPGSAMDSSSLCEYCYCLGGRQQCVKPKCLLPIEGCEPMYEPNNCCPIHYNCSTHDVLSTSSTSTSSTSTTQRINQQKIGGCLVEGIYYEEGGKVLGVGHDVCDNCYCLGGVLRCEPLSCAPPLLGCVPIVKSGDCCAASYNCSGTIEIRPEPNYGHYPIVSKEYAKLYKQVQNQPITERSNLPFYVMAESSQTTRIHQSRPGTFGTTRHFAGITINPSTSKPTTNYILQNTNGLYKTTAKPKSTEPYNTNTDLDADNRFLRRVDTTTNALEESTTVTTTTEAVTTVTEMESTATTVTETTEWQQQSNVSTTVTVLNSTDCIEGNEVENRQESVGNMEVTTMTKQAEARTEIDYVTSEETSAETSTTEDVTEVELDSGISVTTTVAPLPKEIQSILNVTKSKDEDYDYDYNESSLPPSLPNLKIIPFVAADALDSKKDKHNADYGERVPPPEDPALFYSNMFSPPVETEGGFVPKDPPPPILEGFYENVVTPSSSTPAISKCTTLDNREILHGEPVASESACATCTCFYGNIVCQNIPCPLPGPECREAPLQEANLCCPHYICGEEEAPTVVLDRMDVPPKSQEVVTVAEGVKTSDPFRDVIHTEPAPDLQSLIVDMMPFLARKTTPSLTTTTAQPPESENNTYSIDKVLELLFFHGEPPNITSTTPAPPVVATPQPITVSSSSENTRQNSNNHPNSIDAILKLAGCNIYGRMYRVGRIISELSNACLECRCTEIGVQCTPLKC